MKMSRKRSMVGKVVLSTVFCALTIVCFNLAAFAVEDGEYREGAFTYVIQDNKAEIIVVNSTITGECSIPETLNGCPVVSIGANAFWGSSFDSIIVPGTVENIGEGAFSWSNCKKIILPDSVKTMGPAVFKLADELSEIRLSENCDYIPESAFDGCTAITNIKIPQKVTRIDSLSFANCRNLETIEIPGMVEYIGESAFAACDGLTEIHTYGNVTHIGSYAFAYCDALTTATIESPLATMNGRTFWGSTALETVTIDVSAVGSDAFRDCYALKNVRFSKNIKTIGESIFYSSGAEKLYYEGSEEDWDKITIGNGNGLMEDKNNIVFLEVGEENSVPGDVDEDGNVNSRDIILIRRHIAGGYDVTIKETAADVDKNGSTDARDIILIRRYVAGGYDVELG